MRGVSEDLGPVLVTRMIFRGLVGPSRTTRSVASSSGASITRAAVRIAFVGAELGHSIEVVGGTDAV
jgi:hypothetical protein